MYFVKNQQTHQGMSPFQVTYCYCPVQHSEQHAGKSYVVIEKYQSVPAEARGPYAAVQPNAEFPGYVAFPSTIDTSTSTQRARKLGKPTERVVVKAESLKGVAMPGTDVKSVFIEADSQSVDPTLEAWSKSDLVDMRVWLSNPIVAAAANRQRNPDVLSLFVSLHSVLHDLEDRFPGVPFRTLLSTSSSDRPDNFIETLHAAGCDPDDIALIAEHTGCEPTAINIDEPANNRERLRMELADDIVAGLDVDRSKWNREDWARAHAMPTPMSSLQRRVCAVVLEDQFRTMKSIAAELEISPSTVRQTVIKLRYHRSRRLHEWSEE